nr:uncharacterized protein LOC108021595 [Drosophila suzukii]
MAIPKLDLDLFEGNILDSCWKVGGRCRKSHSSAFAQFDRNEIAAVDIVACCKQITNLIEENSFRGRRSDLLATRKKRNVSFKDLSRLAYGATNIYRCQVDILLGDTMLLMEQMKRTNMDLVLTTTKSVMVKESGIGTQRKRKRVITKKSKVTVSKRPRLQESELLNKSTQEYYENILSECRLWQSEYTQQVEEELDESIEPPRSCTQSNSYHAITITEEIQIHEDQSHIMPSDGFGDGEDLDLTIFQELFPKGDQTRTLKRRSETQDSTDILPDKMPRLDEMDVFQADNAIMTQIFPHNIEPADISQICCEPSVQYVLENFEEITYSKPKNPRKRKLIVDKRIEYTREQLAKQRLKYMNDYSSREVIVKKPSKQLKTPNELLCKLNNNLFCSAINNYIGINSSEDQMQDESENTLRTIFGSEFTETLSKEIFAQLADKISSRNIDAYINQPIPLEMEDILLTPEPPSNVIGNDLPINNNNFYEHSILCQSNSFDTYSVMMDLLNIWRNSPEITGINANDFIKSFVDRIKASLAFLHLLYLIRGRFIEISKRANSLEMDQITLGKESAKLIENLTQGETF